MVLIKIYKILKSIIKLWIGIEIDNEATCGARGSREFSSATCQDSDEFVRKE